MKMKLFTTLITVIIIAGCGHSVDLSEKIPGAYSINEQLIQQGDKKISYKDLKQLKIYTDSHFMFTQINPRDSGVSFGVGSYTTDGDTLREHSIYSSVDSTFSDQPRDYNLFIKLTPEGYNQIISNFMIDSIPSTLIEYYNKVTDTSSAPFDGVWKETRSFIVSGNDTLANDRTQYKAFYNGYFMFGNTVKTGSASTFTGMGYGTFKLLDGNEFEETDLNSSYPVIAGNTFSVTYEMPDKDHFNQTFKNADGTLGVEYYERVK